jgi:SpoVK/Ycf46/Vps4 family AAA+-type ATPase
METQQEKKYNFGSLGELITEVQKYKESRKRRKIENKFVVLGEYNEDMENLAYSIEPLKKLNNLIGMETVKKNIIDQILFYSQGLNTNEMMHTCLTGPPGVGKTTLGKILAELYCSMGFLHSGKFKVVSRADLVAGYVGQTAIKTLKVLKEAKGGVLFIDEAYSLGVGEDENKASFGKECIDTINKFLSENTSDFILIIAGYKDELEKHFFPLNKGLVRRFPWTYDISNYSIDNLKDIFVYQVISNGWLFETSVSLNNYSMIKNIFTEYPKLFDHNGGDTLTLFDKAKICHSRRVFGLKYKSKKKLNIVDIRLAIELSKSNKKNTIEIPPAPFGMYT